VRTCRVRGSIRSCTVAIDIKPGTFPNSINLRSNGVVPVAILGSAAFDALQADPASLTLAEAKVKVVGKGSYSCHGEDVNGAGRPDLLCQFPTSQLVIRPGDSTVALEGATLAGARFQGTDTIRIVPH
jgi:nucleoid-associated protein YgaU